MSFPKPIIITSGIALAVILLAVISVALGFIGQPKKYEIADSVDGWVTVTYGNRDCKPLESDGLFVVIRVDASGKGCSSSAMPQGWSYTKFVRVDKSGIQTPLAWGASDSS